MTGSRNSRVPSIGEVRSRFERWRQARQGKVPIPDELWSAAVAVARRDGVNPTAVALHLDGGKLKRRMVASSRSSTKASPPATFVELLAPGQTRAGSRPAEYTLELEGGGGKLRIHCQAAAPAELANLCRTLWDLAR